MKKLSLLLLTLCISLAGWAATLNPYAYNLSSTWNEETQELTVRFTLNAHPNMQKNPDGTTNPDGGQNSGQGIQIFAVDPDTKEQYYIYGIPGSYINERKLAGSYDYEYTIPIDGMSKDADVSKRRPLPAGKNLTWGVVVQGKNRTDQSKPVVVNDNIANRPYSCHGIAVNNNQNSADFGSIYVTEASNGVADNNTWKWLVGKGKSLLKYTPRLEYSTSYQKSSPFSNRDKAACLLEPHRVRISDDGRIFVSSYNRNTTTSQIDVWELKINAQGVSTYETLIKHNTEYGHRLIGMDAKGSGNNVKLLLCYLKEATNANSFRYYEYDVASKTMTFKTSYQNSNSATSINDEDGVSRSVNNQIALTDAITNKYYFYSDGLASVVYDAKNENNFFFGIDYFYNTAYATRLVHYQGTTPTYYNQLGKGHYYGGAGMVTYVEQGTNRGLIAMGRCQTGKGTEESKGRIQVYHNNNESFSRLYEIQTNTRATINDIAIDCAYNIYAVSFTDGTTGNGTGRLIAIAMPYDGKTTTIAPTTNANENKYFNIKPVPNILATDLTYAPYGNENKYEFSFNVNTKPELAQIRFYANEADMLANNGNYSFYYEFSEAERKQGRMSVIFDAVGGTIGNDKLLNDPNGNGLRNLPRGEYYWNVYVKTRKSCAFAPIYTQPAVGASDYHRQHATVDNNPDNEGFGHIYVADHHNIAESNNRVHYVRAYTIGNATGNGKQDNQNNINDNTRYTTHWQVKSNNKVRYTRRPVVSPDGMVYIADEGANQKSAQPTWFKDPNISTYGFVGAGLHVLDPNKQMNNANAVWEANFSNPHGTTGNQEVTTGAYFLYKDGGWKLYRTNTYEEYTIHPAGDGTDYNYQNARWNNNGYRVYSITSTANGLVHSGYNDNATTKRAFGAGDAGGQFSIVATEYGVWMCQHREKTVAEAPLVDGKPSLPDNKENIVLSFFDHSGVRRFTSYTYDNGNLTQKTTSILQSTPGAGMAYQKRGGVEYLYLVNHAGNILEFKITGGATPTLTHTQTYVTGNGTKGAKYGAISSMNFDYAGNLVVTAGATYGVTNGIRDHQELVIYTMPYPNQENARAIPASEAFRLLPERVAHLDMGAAELELIIKGHEGHGCAIDLYRPLQGGEFNTICLPFTLDLTALPEGHPLKNATLKQYTELRLNTVGGEKVLELVFDDVEPKIIAANQPYIIQPENDNGIPHIISFDGPLVLTSTTGESITCSDTEDDKTYSITHQGIVPFQYVEPKKDPNTGEILTLMLVADNRLAAMARGGNMLGFRGYFNLNTPLKGIKARITSSKNAPTNTTIVVDGKKVNVEKFLRDGRVYIRMGETLYSITGEIIER